MPSGSASRSSSATSAGSPSFPATPCVKVPVDEHEEDTLVAALEALADEQVRARDGRGARASSSSASTGSTASPRRYTARDRGASPAARAVEERVLREVAQAAAEVGMDGDDAAFSRRGCARSGLATS